MLVHSVNDDIHLPGDLAIASCLFPLDLLVCCQFAGVQGSGFDALIPVRDRINKSCALQGQKEKAQKAQKVGAAQERKLPQSALRAWTINHRSSIGDDISPFQTSFPRSTPTKHTPSFTPSYIWTGRWV